MKNTLINLVRKLFQILYWSSIVVPLIFLAVSILSYFHVKSVIGEEPTSEDRVWPLASVKHVNLHLPPHDVGLAIILAFMISIISFLFIIIINAAVAGFWKHLSFYKKLALAAVISNIASLIVFYLFPPASWYFGFVLD